jgi:hypothetical protein
MNDYRTKLIKSFILHLDHLAIALHEQADAVCKNTEATEKATKQKAEQQPLTGPLAIELNKSITATIQGEPKTQVKNTWDWRDYLRLVAELVGLGVLIWYAHTTRGLWLQSQKQVKIMQEQLELTDRAWVKMVAVRIIDDFGVALSFGNPSIPPFPAKTFVQLSLEIDERNVGHSSALDIQTAPVLYLLPAAGRSEANIACDSSGAGSQTTAILFPDDTSSLKYVPGVKADISQEQTFGQDPRLISPVLVICIDYRYQSSTVRHHTRMAFEVLHPLESDWIWFRGEKIGAPFFDIGRAVSGKNLNLRLVSSLSFVD